MKNQSILKKYGFLWVTLVFFLFSFIGHWTAAWFAYKSDQQTHNKPVEVQEYVVETFRDTMENWQSEFLQLIWQVAGLSYLWYLGSPQSKEGDDRKEEKLDEILRLLNGQKGEKALQTLNKKYPSK